MLPSLKLPSFPPLPGPHPVGSLDVEIAASSIATNLPTDSKLPKTIHFRLFYPTSSELCEKGSVRPVRWLPEPHQRQYLSGYGRFVGLGEWVSELVSHLPKFLHYISIPALEAAPILPGTSLPILIFSHGLGGTRNAYSYLCTTLASHGILVAAPEHRDGSAPITFMRETLADPDLALDSIPQPGKRYWNKWAGLQGKKSSVAYTAYPHELSEEISAGRNKQLEIRCFELGLLYRFLERLHDGTIEGVARETIHVGPDHQSDDFSSLLAFKGRLPDLHTPGKVAFMGHSFGAATTVQFTKSIFYAKHPPPHQPPDAYIPLFTATDDALGNQVTPDTPTILLDLWCLPLLGPRTRYLFELPLPGYHSPNGPVNTLVIMSDQFFIWKEGMRAVWRVLSPRPGAKGEEIKPLVSIRDGGCLDEGKQGVRWYYVKRSKHLSQSDFGLLFPSQVGANGAEGERQVMGLNTSAIREFLEERAILRSSGSERNQSAEEERLNSNNVAAADSTLVDSLVSLPQNVSLLNPPPLDASSAASLLALWVPLKGGEWLGPEADAAEEAKKADAAMGRRESVHEYVERREGELGQGDGSADGGISEGGRGGEIGARRVGVKIEGEEGIREDRSRL